MITTQINFTRENCHYFLTTFRPYWGIFIVTSKNIDNLKNPNYAKHKSKKSGYLNRKWL
jgi:hypothetical protein